ncbi:oxysterol-binding protein-related protein 10 isoform X2 [Tursiops truncatus]|uniref:Oxysterol-binding protein n=1 Tax=Tursiops truncatus TaxID=9739 RepID=A0A6J3S167_TURTR|nr:oxysterol-binding protein-related protein 10 isoform X2 [Globicephala melas]XP_033720411.1 oxysterol-binding protein-related protein 10 isoform X2 [Tursiops truncatus]
MERAAQGADGGGGSNSSSRSSSRATSAGSSPSCSLAGRGVSGRSAAAGLGGGGSRSSPGSVAASPCGGSGRRREPALEGVLSKYTNLLQGWQNRYFVLDFEAGILQYFVNEQSKHQKPRGALSLSGAIVSLSDEVPHMLVVYSANGEMYKLRAADAKEKQFWVTQLRACAKYHMEMNSKTTPSSRSRSLTLLPHGTPNSASPCSQRHLGAGAPGVVTITHHKSPAAARRAKSQYSGQLHEVREMMTQVEGQQKNLVHAIESLPGSGPLTALDQDLLLLKATSAATLSCLGECLSLLQQSLHQAGQPSHRPGASESILGWHGPKSHSTEQLKNGTLGSLPSASASITWAILPNSVEDEQTCPPEPEPNSGPELVLSEDEKSDTEDQEETEVGVMEDQRSVILHLISQLKLGMDLTKVVLPTFILEKRSLLEMYADFLAHPDLLLAVTAGATPQDRVIGFVEYYLTAFHEGRKGTLAKKPYNPIIGETFHCSWEVPKDRFKPKRTAAPTPSGHEHPMADDPSKNYRMRFVAEQVSHHPPISCFYCVLRLLEHGEEYVFTLPSAYARSILTIPWVELGGKVSITCAKTGYSATVIFHTKPFYGGKVHRVTAEVKHNPTNTIVCKAHGEWNGTLEFTYNNGETKVIDTTMLPVYPKKIRPLEKQGPMESRNLWREVTRCLRLGDIDAATEQKRRLEEKQRTEERKRENLRTPWRPKYFIQEGDGWVYFNPLWKAH